MSDATILPARVKAVIRPEPGIYALLLKCFVERSARLGSLGRLSLRAGDYYVYVGSARGSGGLRGRLGYHAWDYPWSPRWQVDYLKPYMFLTEVWYCYHEWRECGWAATVGAARGAEVTLARAGASDCDCPAHLFHFSRRPSFAAFRRRLSLRGLTNVGVCALRGG
jgi:Uri superfamily endonuclease